MKKTLLFAMLTPVALTFGGCAKQEKQAAEAPAAGGPAPEAYQSAMTAAKAEQSKAAKMRGESRDTDKLIKDAEAAAAAGDFAKAKELADKAAVQGRLGQEQAASQVNVGNPAYLYR